MRKLGLLLFLTLLAVTLAACGSQKKQGSGADDPSGTSAVPSGIYQFVYIGDASGNYVAEKNEQTDESGQTVRLTDEMYRHGDIWYFNIGEEGKGVLTDTASGVTDRAVAFGASAFKDAEGNKYSYKKDGDRFWYEESKGSWAVMEKASQGTIDLIEAGKGGSVPLGEAEVGDLVCLGEYEQTPGNDAMEPIYWRVLTKKDNNLLLLSDKLLDAYSFMHLTEEDVDYGTSWKTSTVRRFLNGEFLETCFSDAEKALMVTTHLKNTAANKYLSTYWNFKKSPFNLMKRQSQKNGVETDDKIFLLSVGEVLKYLEDDPDAKKNSNAEYPFSELPVQKSRIAYVTKAVAEQGAGFFDANTLQGAWLTRTLCNLDGTNNLGIVYVTGDGQFFNYYTDQPLLIRPAMWVSAVTVEP